MAEQRGPSSRESENHSIGSLLDGIDGAQSEEPTNNIQMYPEDTTFHQDGHLNVQPTETRSRVDLGLTENVERDGAANNFMPVADPVHSRVQRSLRPQTVASGAEQPVVGTPQASYAIILTVTNLPPSLGSRVLKKAFKQRGLEGVINKITLEGNHQQSVVCRLCNIRQRDRLRELMPSSTMIQSYNSHVLREYGALCVLLRNSHQYKDVDFQNEEHHIFMRAITRIHLISNVIVIDEFDRRCKFNKTEEGDWCMEVALQDHEKETLHTYINSESESGNFEDEMPNIVMELSLRSYHNQTHISSPESAGMPNRDKNRDDQHRCGSHGGDNRNGSSGASASGQRSPGGDFTGGDNSGLQDSDTFLAQMIKQLSSLQCKSLRQRVMQKLAQCHPHPVKALAKLYPLTSQVVVPKNSNNLIRYALILYNTQERLGANEEAKLLEEGLSHVGFKVTSQEWKTSAELKEKTRAHLREQRDRCSVVFISIMSHGYNGVLRGTGNSAISVNSLLQLTSDIIQPHIPMIHLIQACQHTPKSQPAAIEHIELNRPNTVLLMATVADGMALRGAYTGAFSDALLRVSASADISELHTRAASRIHKLGVIDQVPILRSTLSKCLQLTSTEKMPDAHRNEPASLFNIALDSTGRIGHPCELLDGIVQPTVHNSSEPNESVKCPRQIKRRKEAQRLKDTRSTNRSKEDEWRRAKLQEYNSIYFIIVLNAVKHLLIPLNTITTHQPQSSCNWANQNNYTILSQFWPVYCFVLLDALLAIIAWSLTVELVAKFQHR